ncbi:MAG: hypothetical protein ACI857_000005 [Arenicella sp.]|jgi:hypothetical protein
MLAEIGFSPKIGLPFLESKSEIVASGVLDQNGFATFDLKMKNNRRYILGVSEPSEICYGGLTNHYLEHEDNNTILFDYAHCAYLKINFNNTNCFDSNDHFKFYYQGREVPGKEGLIGALAHEGIGCYNYINPDFTATPMGDYYYSWDIVRNGVQTTIYDTISLGKGEYFTYDVNY